MGGVGGQFSRNLNWPEKRSSGIQDNVHLEFSMPFWNVPSCNVNFLLLYQAEFNNYVIFNCTVTCSTMATSALAIFSVHWRLIKSCTTAPVTTSPSRILLFSFVSHAPDTFSLFFPRGIFCRSLSRAFQYENKHDNKKDEEAKEKLPAPCAQEIQSA